MHLASCEIDVWWEAGPSIKNPTFRRFQLELTNVLLGGSNNNKNMWFDHEKVVLSTEKKTSDHKKWGVDPVDSINNFQGAS